MDQELFDTNAGGPRVPLRATSDGALLVSLQGAAPGGTSTSDTTEATQLAVKSAVDAVNTKTPALESGRVPVALPAGLATETTAAAALAELESLDAKTPALESGRVPVALPAGLATEATLVAGAVSRWDQVALVSSDEATAGTVYLLYRPSKAGTGLLWGLKRVITAGASTEIRYAGPANNPAVTDPWASRAGLVYGLPQEA